MANFDLPPAVAYFLNQLRGLLFAPGSHFSLASLAWSAQAAAQDQKPQSNADAAKPADAQAPHLADCPALRRA